MQIFDPPPPEPAERRRRLPARWWPRFPAVVAPRLRVPGFARRPMAWIIGAETAVTAAFVLAAAHLLASSLPASSTGADLPANLPTAAPSTAPPDVSGLMAQGAQASSSPRPGLGRSSGFLGGLMSGLNQDQASFEREEWSALQALSGAIRSYIEQVMLPAVEKAANGAAGPRSP